MDAPEDYFYSQIGDAQLSVGARVNLIGAVSSISEKKKTKGTVPTRLPCVRSIGDIIIIHQLEVKLYQGIAHGVYNKKISSFALFEGNPIEGFHNYQKSVNYQATEHEDDLLSKISTWLLHNAPEAVRKDQLFPICHLKTGCPFDLVCKVLHVSITSEGDCLLFVWDGTDAPTANIETDLDLEGEYPCPLHAGEFLPSAETFCTFPFMGSVVWVFAGKHFKMISDLYGGGQWVKLQNMLCEFHYGMLYGMLTPSSKIILVSDEEWVVQYRLKNYDDRNAIPMRRYPMSFSIPSRITVVDCDDVTCITLRHSIAYPEVTHKCMCIVRLVAAYPWKGEDLISPVTGRYRVRFTLEDPTARIHAFLSAEDGVNFFDGYPNSDVLASKMKKLLGIPDSSDGPTDCARNPPWFRCCLTSYYLDKSQPRESRRYRIFGTKLVV
ncbi:protection of telomeres protein 1a-like isoform X2 [Curcuma longa]|uniref:protection of telomeres protein 1a-like isoform X2 n=1 Tax=Curcuma longa TaxID=136217 RepID=UPI003D9E60B5